MGLPLFRLFSLMIRMASRPISRMMVLLLRKQRLSHDWFSCVGLKAHELEAYLDFKAANPDKKVTRAMLNVSPIEKEESF